MFRTVAAIFLLLALPVGAQTSQPSDSELRTAYCLTATKAWVETFQSLGPKSQNSDQTQQLIANIQRFEAYLEDKGSDRQGRTFLGAAKRARADQQSTSDGIGVCLRECSGSNERGACVAACQRKSGALARLEACEKVDWLPY